MKAKDSVSEPIMAKRYSSSSIFHAEESKKGKMWKWSDILLITFLIVIGSGIGSIYLLAFFSLRGGGDFDFNSLGTPLTFYDLALALNTGFLIGSVYFLGIQGKGLSWKTFGFRPLTKAWIVVASVVGIGIIPLELLAGIVIDKLNIPDLPPVVAASVLGTTGFSWSNLIVLIIITLLALPLGIEMFFRGVIYTFLYERWGFLAALVVSTAFCMVFYGLLDLSISDGIINGMTSLIIGIVYARSKSLNAAVIVHCLANTIIVWISLPPWHQLMQLPLF